MTEPPMELTPSSEDEPIQEVPRRERVLARARRLGWIVALPSVAYVFWISSQASDPDVAAEAIGRIYGYILIGYFVVWLVGRFTNRPALRGWWGWTFVLLALAVLLLVALPVGIPRDVSIASYVRPANGFTYEVDEEDQAAFRTAIDELDLESGDLEEAELYYVMDGEEIVGILQVMAFRPSLTGPSDSFWEGMRSGLAEPNSSSIDIEIAGEPAVLFESAGLVSIFWHDENLAMTLASADESTAREVATSLRSANASE